MKFLFFLLFTIPEALAKPLVMITYYDPFNRAPFNNSERIAKSLAARLNRPQSPVVLELCALSTIFDKAYGQSEDCLRGLPESPVMVIGLGESTCQLKIETIMRNKDKTNGPDNEGNHRSNTPIIVDGPDMISLRYPLPQMYCALSATERSEVDLSNSAGSFVCNNTSYQMSYYYPDLQFGFIHVPANNCSNLSRRNESAITMLEKMILKGVTYLLDNKVNPGLPHSSNNLRLPGTKDELKKLLKTYDNKNDCLHQYLKKAKPY